VASPHRMRYLDAMDVNDLPFDLPVFEPGWVWLAGAGPGDPGLITLHTANALRQADVVVYDALVGKEILDLAPAAAALEYAGKRGGKPSPKQPDISRRLISLAKAGKRVLRLKGGDPFVFGRGGEEALALVEAAVPFRVIPGVSAGIGGLGWAGIPVTHRAVNAAVTFVTGHDAAGAVPNTVDWAALGRGSPVLVMYMALKHLPGIRERLLGAGRRPDEPVAIVASATLPGQTVLETTLGNCVTDLQANPVDPPAIVVLGDVVRLRSGLDWQGALDGRQLSPAPLDEPYGGGNG